MYGSPILLASTANKKALINSKKKNKKKYEEYLHLQKKNKNKRIRCRHDIDCFSESVTKV